MKKTEIKPKKKVLNEMEISCCCFCCFLPDKEFKIIILNMLAKIRERMDEHNEDFNKIPYRSPRAEDYNNGTKKNTVDEAEERKDRAVEITNQHNKKKKKLSENSLKDL